MHVSWKRMKGVGLSVLALVLLSGGLTPVRAAAEAVAVQEAEGNVALRWAFGALVGGGGSEKKKLEPVAQNMVLKTGDQFKMMVELQKRCFVYVLYHNTQDDVQLLFPYSLAQFDGDYAPGKKYYLPQGDAWYKLDEHTGKETFYLLASNQRLTDLERLLGEYASAGAAEKPEAAKKILAEIRELRKQNRELAAPAERPVTIGGTIRGIETAQGAATPDVEPLAEEITSDGFYGKAFILEHQ